MTCTCRCCADAKPCARVLMLSPKDTSDAARVLAIAGETAGQRVVDLTVAMPSWHDIAGERRPGKLEPMADVACRSCRRTYPVFQYMATFVEEHSVTVQCEVCR